MNTRAIGVDPGRVKVRRQNALANDGSFFISVYVDEKMAGYIQPSKSGRRSQFVKVGGSAGRYELTDSGNGFVIMDLGEQIPNRPKMSKARDRHPV